MLAELAEDPLQRGQHRLLVARQRLGLAQVVGGAVQIGKLVLVERRQPHGQGALQPGVERGVHALGVDVGQAGPVLVGRGQTLQRLPRLVDGGVLGQGAGPGGERHLHVASLGLLDAGDLGQQVEASRDRVLDGQAQLEKLDDTVPGLGGPLERLEDGDRGQPVVIAPGDGVERVARPGVLGRPGQDLGVTADGRFHVAQLGLDQPRGAESQLVARRGVLRPGGARVEHFDQIRLSPLGGQDPIEIAQRLAVARASRPAARAAGRWPDPARRGSPRRCGRSA